MMEPLLANGIRQLETLCSLDPENGDTRLLLRTLQDGLKTDTQDIKSAIGLLSNYLLDHHYCVDIAKCFPKLVLQILYEKIPLKIVSFTNDENLKRIHISNCILLGKLIVVHPDVLDFSLKYFDVYPSPFKWISEFSSSIFSECDIAECCYNFLKLKPSTFRNKWKWSEFLSHFINTSNSRVKWLTHQCVVIILGMSEYRSEELKSSSDDSSIVFMESLRNEFATPKTNVLRNQNVLSVEEIPIVNDLVVNVSGVLLPAFGVMHKQKDNVLIPVKSTTDNLRSLALAVVSGNAVCLVGPVGSGKTALVEHLARVTGRSDNDLKKVQLGDQTDSRSLLGTYRCTDIPGEFIWQPGILTQAVIKGQWLLMEDIDCAAVDIASVLCSLLERNVLSVPGYRDSIPITPGFQLFFTQRTLNAIGGYHKAQSNAGVLLQKYWTQINVEPLSKQELITIVDEMFPKLKTISTKIVNVFMLFSLGSHQTISQDLDLYNKMETPLLSVITPEICEFLSYRNGRLISTRDLIKLCSRIPDDFDVSTLESGLELFQNAIDIFTCYIPDKSARLALFRAISAILGIRDSRADFYCISYKPNIEFKPSKIHIGRTFIQKKETLISEVNLNEKKVTFSFTRPSMCLLERICCCLNLKEPVLLVGETGTGKTSSVQYLAKKTGNKLLVINMNQQSDSSDLLGGYKPVDIKYMISPIRKEFEYLFRSYFDAVKNTVFLENISKCFNASDWKTLLMLMKQSQMAAIKRLENDNSIAANSRKRKLDESKSFVNITDLKNEWNRFGEKLEKLKKQIKSQASLAFSFIEGSLIKALKEGYWVLLDEINLASAETLECLSGLLESHNNSINLLERGDDFFIKRHKEFKLFACMNPATDVGKKDLPIGLRNRFTEFYVDELTDMNDLLLLIGDYLKDLSLPPTILESIYKFYIYIGKEAKLSLTDGTGQSPHYSLRTLCRALHIAANTNCGTVTRTLYESFCISFLTQLDNSSHPRVQKMIATAVLGKKSLNSVLQQSIPCPKSSKDEVFLSFEGYWISKGSLEPVIPDDYILTSSVRKNLKDLVRIISLGKLPILLQGDTSVGKTSLITYLAKASGNCCVRINNHQHTDIQEYIGSYATDSTGKLIFREGVLVEAMRKGYWIILDELNLAPSDVLEALNRVLDDNKELFIPETQQVVKAHPKFMLFATQNPPGLYGGRNVLSRAFRNRFVELHFDEIPRNELEIILHQRCHMPLSYCKKVLLVMAELQLRRKNSAAIQGKESFITLRDLFRWGQRYKLASNEENVAGKYYDWDQHIADEGYLVLAGRVRNDDERMVIQEVLQKHIKRTVDPNNLFSLHKNTSLVTRNILEELLSVKDDSLNNIVWTFNMRKLAVLVAKSFYFKEPVLLVGETGCGKTTVCQILAVIRNSKLMSVNCHMHTESSDFLGGLRPVRHHEKDNDRLFEWVDGPLIDAMKSGAVFLTDEISLADDSVLERLNSLLEPERQILLSEKGLSSEDNLSHMVQAIDEFRFIGTMNPGGDYGKKELSPALRNRFTEIWCDSITIREDLLLVLQKSLNPDIQCEIVEKICNYILDFVDWIKKTEISDKLPCTIRDLLAWTYFINETTKSMNINVYDAYLHGAALVFLDSFGTGTLMTDNISELIALKRQAVQFLINQIIDKDSEKASYYEKLLLNIKAEIQIKRVDDKFGVEPFFIDCITNSISDTNFNFMAPTTGINTLRLLRGLQLKKAILLEGSPGVGKTTLVTALAKVTGHKILRINLSDQTDISDLFGADLPTADGSFKWKDGEFLSALKNGDWILLDELNLAPQSVLEGLNACLDHRGEIFIPELGKSFVVKEKTKIFACQNPLRQGGARRGLPKSFLNRFTQVYVDTLSSTDLKFILSSQYPSIPQNILNKMIEFNDRILKEVTEMKWGYKGSPWELNLRDIQRWCDGLMKDYVKKSIFLQNESTQSLQPGKFAKLLYVERMRTKEDKQHVRRIYEDIFHPEYPMMNDNPKIYTTNKRVHIGDTDVERCTDDIYIKSRQELLILRHQIPTLKSLMECVQMNWLSILIGPTASGKTSCVQVLSEILGKELKILSVTSAMDTADFLGGFEQADYNRRLEEISSDVENIILTYCQKWFLKKKVELVIQILKQWEIFKEIDSTNSNDVKKQTMDKEMEIFVSKQKQLEKILDILSCEQNENKIVDIRNKLTTLMNLVMKDGSINAGGKFEWVDSILVKCLLNGSWLLIDNVNLCSSAVLDRLNCLLETQGTLTIPERGNQIDTIKPHPNFRIFFTMDPKNGEISRAMRNRGVEIYMTGNEDFIGASITDVVPYLDLSALLKSTGLSSRYHEFFIEMHKSMCSFIKSFEKPSQCHLIQTSNLVCQQLLRGETEFTAIVNSFSDVYIKPRSFVDFLNHNSSLVECKSEMLEKLCDNTNSFLSKNVQISTFSNHTLNCIGLCEMSSLEQIKQDLYFLEKTLSSIDDEFTDEIVYKLSHLFYNVYHLSSPRDVIIRYNFIDQLLNHMKVSTNSEVLKWCLSLNKNLYEFVSTSIKKEIIEYPWDINVLNDISGKNIPSLDNNKVLYLYFTALKSQNIDLKPQNHIRIIDHSKSIANGSYSDVYSGSILIKFVYPLIDQLDKYIKTTILNENSKMTNSEWCNWVMTLNWFNRFLNCSNLPLFDNSKKKSKIKHLLMRESIDDLILHYKWMSKYLIKKLMLMSDLNTGIRSILSEIDRSLASTNSPFKIINKRFNKIVGQPVLYENEDAYLRTRLRQDIIKKSFRTKILMRNVKSTIHINLHENESRLLRDIHNLFGCPEKSIDESLKNLHNQIEISENSQNEIEESAGNCCLMQLWPIEDFIVQKVFNLHHIEIITVLFKYFLNIVKHIEIDKENSLLNNNMNEYILTVVNRLKYFPIKLNSLVSFVTSKFGNIDDYKSLNEYYSEISDLITQYKENSPACYSNFWINLENNLSQNSTEEFNTKICEAIPLNYPHLTHFSMKFVVNNELNSIKTDTVDNNVVFVSLMKWKERSKQLKYLHNLLWKNICILSSNSLQNKSSDAKIITINYEKMIMSLESALSKNKTVDESMDVTVADYDLKSVVNDCVMKITHLYNAPENYYTEDMIHVKNQYIKCLNESFEVFTELKRATNTKEINKDDVEILMLTGSLWTLLSVCNIILSANIQNVDEVRKDRLKMDYLKEDLKSSEFLLSGKVMHNVLYGTISVSESEAKNIISCDNNEEMISSNSSLAMLYQQLLNCYPHHSSLVEKRNLFDQKIKSISLNNHYRPSEPSYNDLVKEYDYFANSLGSIDSMLLNYNNLKKGNDILKDLIANKQSYSNINSELNFINDVIQFYSTWKYSVKNFYKKISDKFSLVFPDVVIPLLNGITQLCYGLDLLKSCIKKQLAKFKFEQDDSVSLKNYTEDLIRFPIINEQCQDATQLFNIFASKSFIDYLKRGLSSQNITGVNSNINECYRLLKVNYQELYCKCICDGTINDNTWNNLLSVLTEFVTMWQKQCETIEKEKQEKESLYVTKCAELPEDEQIENEIKDMFPSYVDLDFVDFKQRTLDEKKDRNSSKETKSDESHVCITTVEIDWVVRLHTVLMKEFTAAEWLSAPTNKKLSCDYLTPLLERYKISASIWDSICYGLDESFDSKTLPSLLVLVKQARNIIEGFDMNTVNSNSKSNFYQSSWVSETKKCLPILETVKERTKSLLQEWPDFPLLNDIMTVVDRILDFPVTSPIVRFLTGIELLRDKIEDWNKNARKIDSMEDLGLLIAQQIVTWRRLELSTWKDSLNNSFDRLQSEANKWWFHIYTLIECYISEKPINSDQDSVIISNNNDILNSQQFIEAMQNFIEKSPLVEYEKRLDIIYVMHCHCIHQTPSVRRDEVISILWNVFKYYSQFTEQIVKKIKEKRAPIEKKLRDFVKICTWERDLSYWAVKEIVDKAHKTLHKHIKEFETMLQTMANSCFSLESPSDNKNELCGLWDRPKRSILPITSDYSVDVQLFLISSRIYKKFFESEDDKINKDSLSKIETLTFKAKDICKNIIVNSSYANMLNGYNNFVTQIIESIEYLKGLEVTPGIPKEKQKTQAKGFIQQKRKALSDLFQALTELGVSYRTGLMEMVTKNGNLFDFLISPVDLESSLSYLKNKRCDSILISQWKGCDLYFQRCISRSKGLSAVLLKPSPEVGLQNIDRLKGFTAHLLIIIQEQKSKLSKYFKVHCYLRRKIKHITDLCGSNNVKKDQSELLSQHQRLKDVFSVIINTAQQFEIVLKAVPENDFDVEENKCIAFDDVFLTNSSMKCYKNDESWNYLNNNIEQIIVLANRQRDSLNQISFDMPTIFELSKKLKYGTGNCFTQSDEEILDKSINILKDIKIKMNEMINKFSDRSEKSDFYNPIMNTIITLDKLLEKNLIDLNANINTDINTVEEKEFENELSSQIKALVHFILIVIQDNHKRNNEDCSPDSKSNDTQDNLPPKMLKVEFQQKLMYTISKLQLNQICQKIDLILNMINSFIGKSDKWKVQLSNCIPLLEQISLFAQFYITQQVTVHRISCKMLSVILNIFIELGSKGFCTPEEFKDENQEGEGPGKQSGGLGLGDGEGQKDVSEEIENQDQLEDAMRPGEEKNEDKKDCKEEGKGIEMSDDFDSHLQDVENKDEDSDENSDNDDDDADKQMGDTEPNADKLDKQLWGSDDEDEDKEENTNQENEERGAGKELNDKQMGAKDDGKNDQTEDDVGEERNDRKQKNDINEMKEPEEDEDHVDPYHGNQEPLPEPEPMDLPDNLSVGDEENDKQDDESENNPFEIDVMKDKKDEVNETEEDKSEEKHSKDKEDLNKNESDDSDDENNQPDSDNEKEQNKDDQEEEANKSENENEEDQLKQSAEDEKDDNEAENQNETKNNKNDDANKETDPEESEEIPLSESQPSHDKPSNEENIESTEAETGSKDTTETNPQIDKEKQMAPYEQSQEQEGDEEEGVGQSELSMDQKGHISKKKDKPHSASRDNLQEEKEKRPEKRNKPGSTDQDRALGKSEEPFKKKSKTVNIKNKEDDTSENGEENGADEKADEDNMEIYQHIKEAKETDTQVIDAATEDQAKKQSIPNKPEDEDAEEPKSDDIIMDDIEDIDTNEDMSEEIKPEKMGEAKNKKNEKTSNRGDVQEEITGDMGVEVEGEDILTLGVERGSETTYHTKLDSTRVQFDNTFKSSITGNSIRQNLQNYQIASVSADESAMWHSLWGKTSSQAKLLTEKLRLVLEPTGLSRLAGDYRTGKRINMRRIIPYIASHFRKDRIWLRRTKPARREYRIAVAMDDSSSMCDNQSKELAFESLALVSQALNLLEAGDLSVLSFGEDTKILHPFSEQFTENSGCKIIHNLKFEQKKTRIAQMLDFTSVMFEELCRSSNALNAKLLLIVSDGRGIFSEGETKVLQTIRKVRQQGIFVVYLIVDNPKNKTSIMDIRVPKFDQLTNQLTCIQSYLDNFPFPFYLILRDITMLPSVLSDAMRQWFELAANMDK